MALGGIWLRGACATLPAALALILIPQSAPTQSSPPPAAPPGLEKIKQFVFIMQENRSFDHYFGTYPGAEGIPPGVCMPNGREPVRAALPRHRSSESRRPPRLVQRAHLHRWRTDGRIHGGLGKPAMSWDGTITTKFRTIGITRTSMCCRIGCSNRLLPTACRRISTCWRRRAADMYGTGQPYPASFGFPEITVLLGSGKINWKYYVNRGPSRRRIRMQAATLTTSTKPLHFLEPASGFSRGEKRSCAIQPPYQCDAVLYGCAERHAAAGKLGDSQ